MSDRPLGDRDLRAVAGRFRILAVPARLRILQQLRGGPQHGTALIDATGLRQANLSKHLSVLHTHGIVARVRLGRFVRYAIADPAVMALCDVVCGQVTARARRRAPAAGDAVVSPAARRRRAAGVRARVAVAK